MAYNKDEVKDALELEDVYNLMEQLGAEPEMFSDHLECLTICHSGHSKKLWYFDNTKLFKCFTHCQDTFDVFGLLQKVKDFSLNEAVYYIVQFFNLDWKLEQTDAGMLTEDWKLFKRYQEISDIEIKHDKIVLPQIDEDVIKYYPTPLIRPWINEYIPKEVCDYAHIKYDPVRGGILIPHYDENNRLIGIRERTLIQENEIYGKYRPWQQGKKMYNHPLAFNLYNINNSKDNISRMGIALVHESEKGCLQSIGYLGTANDISVAVCGSSISNYQFNLLLSFGMREMAVCFDRDFEKVGDENYYQVISKLQKIYDKFSASCNVSFLFDKHGDKLEYKNSPTDKGRDIFMQLWKDRVFL